MADRNSLTLWGALLWTYRKQRAHVYLSTGRLCFDWAISAGNLTDDGPRPKVHWDAAMIHGAVCEIGEQHGQLVAEAVMMAAVLGERPELPDTMPVPMPYEIDGHRRLRPGRAPEYITVDTAPSKQRPPMSRPGRGVYQGRRIEILIRTIDFQVGTRPVYDRRGRTKITETGTEPVWLPVEYCPLRWEPDPGYYAAAIGAYRAWSEGMILLGKAAAVLELHDHIITVEDIPPAPDVTTLEFDSWADYRNEHAEVNADVVQLAGGVESRLFEDSEMLVERQARATVVR